VLFKNSIISKFTLISDVDECLNGDPCGRNRACVNTKGGYECINAKCPNAYFIRRSTT
jgi:hypothetical protein